MAKAALKQRSEFMCDECGASATRWMGRCPTCGAWNTLREVAFRKPSGSAGRRPHTLQSPERISDVVPARGDGRVPSGFGELDRALGGGFVPGGVVLLGGDPGIGKSTLLLQSVASAASAGESVFYLTAEESVGQVASRARRLELAGAADIVVQATDDIDAALSMLEANPPKLFVLDSIQTVRSGAIESSAGGVTQLREVTERVIAWAKRLDVAAVLVGHVTKDGALAGPKMLEHLVDTVLAFEGESSGALRVIRATKNRFGPTNEVGFFEMVREGLREVSDPSAFFLAERPEAAAGSVVTPTVEGSRPMLVEVQALVAAAAYGSARRVCSGIDSNRLAILLAVLDRRAGVHVLDRDVFVSVAGGIRIEERAADLALALAVVSSLRDRPIQKQLAVLGEVGLTGELRAVPRLDARLGEVAKLGFRRVLVPQGNATRLDRSAAAGVDVIGFNRLDDALDAALM